MKRASKLLGTIIPSVEDIKLIMQPTRFTMHKTADSMSSTLPYSAEYQGIMKMNSRFTEPFDLYSGAIYVGLYR